MKARLLLVMLWPALLKPVLSLAQAEETSRRQDLEADIQSLSALVAQKSGLLNELQAQVHNFTERASKLSTQATAPSSQLSRTPRGTSAENGNTPAAPATPLTPLDTALGQASDGKTPAQTPADGSQLDQQTHRAEGETLQDAPTEPIGSTEAGPQTQSATAKDSSDASGDNGATTQMTLEDTEGVHSVGGETAAPGAETGTAPPAKESTNEQMTLEDADEAASENDATTAKDTSEAGEDKAGEHQMTPGDTEMGDGEGGETSVPGPETGKAPPAKESQDDQMTLEDADAEAAPENDATTAKGTSEASGDKAGESQMTFEDTEIADGVGGEATVPGAETGEAPPAKESADSQMTLEDADEAASENDATTAQDTSEAGGDKTGETQMTPADTEIVDSVDDETHVPGAETGNALPAIGSADGQMTVEDADEQAASENDATTAKDTIEAGGDKAGESQMTLADTESVDGESSVPDAETGNALPEKESPDESPDGQMTLEDADEQAASENDATTAKDSSEAGGDKAGESQMTLADTESVDGVGDQSSVPDAETGNALPAKESADSQMTLEDADEAASENDATTAKDSSEAGGDKAEASKMTLDIENVDSVGDGATVPGVETGNALPAEDSADGQMTVEAAGEESASENDATNGQMTLEESGDAAADGAGEPDPSAPNTDSQLPHLTPQDIIPIDTSSQSQTTESLKSPQQDDGSEVGKMNDEGQSALDAQDGFEATECDDSYCLNGGLCRPIPGGRRCRCRPGFFGAQCESGCEIFTDCESCVQPKAVSKRKRSGEVPDSRRKLIESFRLRGPNSGGLRGSKRRPEGDAMANGDDAFRSSRQLQVVCGWMNGRCVNTEETSDAQLSCDGISDQAPPKFPDDALQVAQQAEGDISSASPVDETTEQAPVQSGLADTPKDMVGDGKWTLPHLKAQILPALNGEPNAWGEFGGAMAMGVPALGVVLVIVLLCVCARSRCRVRHASAASAGSASMPYQKLPTQEPRSDFEECYETNSKSSAPPSRASDQRRAEQQARRDAIRAKREMGRARRVSKDGEDLNGGEGNDRDEQSDQLRLLQTRQQVGIPLRKPSKDYDDASDGPPSHDTHLPKMLPQKVPKNEPPPKPRRQDDDPFANLGIAAAPKFGEDGRGSVSISSSHAPKTKVAVSDNSRPRKNHTARSQAGTRASKSAPRPATAATAKPQATPVSAWAPAKKTGTPPPTADSLMDVAAWDRDDDLDDILNS